MTAELIRTLYRYNTWATERVLDAAANLDSSGWTRPAANSAMPLRQTLVHLVGTQQSWLAWWDGSLPAEQAYALYLEPDAFPDVESLRSAWREIDASTTAFLDGLEDADLARDYETSVRGRPFKLQLGPMLLHVANHATQHRSEAAAMLTEAGCSPGELDTLWFLLRPA